MSRHVPAPPYVLLALATLFWSGNFVLGRAVSARIPPVGMAFWGWVGALAATNAMLLLGESFRLYHLLGIGMILSGVTLAGAAAQAGRPARGEGASG